MKINIKDLKKRPCKKYLELFDSNGNIDILGAFDKLGQQWYWLLSNSNNFDWFEVTLALTTLISYVATLGDME